MFAREWKKARRAEAATPTPSMNNIESIADEECVTLGYYEANEEQTEEQTEGQAEEESQGELEKNACYGGIMFLRDWKKTRRSVASTPTPSTNNIESVAVDEECVQLGYYETPEEQIQEEQEKNAGCEGMMSTREFHWHRSASWKACHFGFFYRQARPI